MDEKAIKNQAIKSIKIQRKNQWVHATATTSKFPFKRRITLNRRSSTNQWQKETMNFASLLAVVAIILQSTFLTQGN